MPNRLSRITSKANKAIHHALADHPVCAAVLVENKEEILNRFVERVRSALPAAQRQTRAALENSLPHLLDKIVEILLGDLNVESAEMHEAAKRHGFQRSQLRDYTLDQVIHEYSIFRKLMFDVLREHGCLDDRATDTILDCIQQGIEEATREFLIFSGELVETSERKFEHFVDAVQDCAMLTLDESGRVTSWNKGAEKIKGYKSNEVIGHHVSMFYSPDAVAAGEPDRNLEVARKRGRFEQLGWRVRKDGTVFWAELVLTAVFDKSGRLTGYFKVVRDLTETRSLENELRATQERFAMSLEASKVGIWEWNMKTNALDWSKEASAIFGYDTENLSPGFDDFRRRVHPTDWSKVQKTIEEAAAGTGHYDTEYRLVWPDGTVHWIVARGQVTFDKHGSPEIMRGTVVESTQSKTAVDGLRRVLKEVNDIKFALDASSIVAITDLRGRITYVNEKFCQISKYSRAELIGRDHRIINSGYHSKEFFQNLWTTISAGDIWHGEIKNKAKDGTFYWVDTFIVPTLDDKGNPYQYVAIRTDISEKKAVEMQIIEKNAELLRSNADLDALAAVAAHDLKSPVNSVTQFTELLARRYKGKFDADADEYMDFIINAGKRMTHLVDSLLQYARVGNMIKEDRKPVLLTEVIGNVRKNLLVETDETGASITTDQLPVVKGEVGLLTQLFQNLIANAIKYRTPGLRPLVQISSKEIGEKYLITVSDNGVGIPEKHTKRIFELFKKAHASNSYEGAGIGLAVVKRIVESHGGTIHVESQVGKGSSFHFDLPKAN